MNKHKLSFDFTQRMEDLFTQRKKFFIEELIQWLSPTLLDKAKISEQILKNTRVIYEKVSRSNLAFFKKTYPEYIANISEDKSNSGYSMIKYYVNKL